MAFGKVRLPRLYGAVLLVFLFVASCSHVPPADKPDIPDKPLPAARNLLQVAYYASWTAYGDRYQLARVPAKSLTHLLYAFGGLSPEGSVFLLDPAIDIKDRSPNATGGPGGNFAVFPQLRELNPSLRIFVSLGGWNGSRYFSLVVGDPHRRALFCESVLAFLRRHDFDGVDLDWEFPVDGGSRDNLTSAEDAANLSLLLRDLKACFDGTVTPRGTPYGISMALSPLSRHLSRLDASTINITCEFVSLMTYNYRGGWDNLAGHASPLVPGLQQALDCALTTGFAPERLLVGVPLFARGWKIQDTGSVEALRQNDDHILLGSKTIPADSRPPKGERDGGTWNVETILSGGLEGLRLWDDQAMSACTWNPATGLFVSHEDERSLSAKLKWIARLGLGGVMFWEASGDYRNRLMELTGRFRDEHASLDAGQVR